MEISTQHLELVRDALYARDMKYVESFAFNKASERIREVGLPILPTLEYVIRDEVMPSCPVDAVSQLKVFPGISSLMVDYLKITKNDGHLERAVAFVSSLNGAVLIEAIRYLSIEWDRVIPEPFLKIVEKTLNSGSLEEREIASWALNWHRKKRDTVNC